MADIYATMKYLIASDGPLIKDEVRVLFPYMQENELNNRIAALMQDKELIVHKESVHDEFMYLVPTSSP